MTDNSPGLGRLLAPLALGVFAATAVARITDPLVGVLAQDLNATAARVALLASAFALPFALIQPILGPVGDALGKRRVIAIGLGLLAVILAISSLATSLDMLLVLRGLSGLAAGTVMPLAIALVGDSVSMKDRQVALSRLVAFVITGQIAGGSISGLLEPYLGWRGVLLAAALLVAAAVAATLLGARSRPPEPRHAFDPAQAVRRYRDLMRMPAARLLYVSVAIEGGLVFGCFSYFAPMLQARGLGATAEAGLTVAAFGCGGLLYAAIAKAVLRRLGQGRMVMLGGGLCLLAMAGFAFAPAAWLFIGAGLFLGTGMYMIHNSIQTRVTELAPQARGSAVALHAFHFFVGQTIGPVLYGVALSHLGAPPAMLLAGVGLLGLALLLGWRVSRAEAARTH
jgi:predicted MFS family arabinose efflux permease